MEQRVLFTASTWSHIHNFHRPYLAEFRRLGWRVDVACGGAPVEIGEAHRCIQVPFEKSMFSPKNLAAVGVLRREMAAEGYALVITHTSLAAFFTRMAVRGLAPRPRVVNVSHGYLFDDETPPLKRALLLGAERLTAPVTDLLLTMNRWDYEAAQHHRLGREIRYIPGMGVDFDRATPPAAGTRETLRGEFGFSQDAFLLIYGAEFSKRKNQAMLIRALADLPERVGLLLPGDGALLGHCMALARALGVERRVVFPGHVGGMGRWYAAADCAVSSSRSEGLPFNIMEAMHLGLPVVASAVKGHTDLVEHGESGLLYPFDDAGAFAAQISALLDDPAIVRRLGKTAQLLSTQYALSAVLPRIMSEYAQNMYNQIV